MKPQASSRWRQSTIPITTHAPLDAPSLQYRSIFVAEHQLHLTAGQSGVKRTAPERPAPRSTHNHCHQDTCQIKVVQSSGTRFSSRAPGSTKELRQVRRCSGCNHTGRQAQERRGQHRCKRNTDIEHQNSQLIKFGQTQHLAPAPPAHQRKPYKEAGRMDA